MMDGKLLVREYGSPDNIVEPRAGDVGYDLRVSETVEVFFNTIQVINTGVAIEIPTGYFGFISVRSSLGLKGLFLMNTPAVIDTGYRGELKLICMFIGETERLILYKGDRIAQLVLLPATVFPIEHGELTPTQRGEQGLGSTGV